MAGKKLKNKYFATRCVLGDVSIWSAMPRPDRVFDLVNVDAEEQAGQQETHRDSKIDEEDDPA